MRARVDGGTIVARPLIGRVDGVAGKFDQRAAIDPERFANAVLRAIDNSGDVLGKPDQRRRKLAGKAIGSLAPGIVGDRDERIHDVLTCRWATSPVNSVNDEDPSWKN